MKNKAFIVSNVWARMISFEKAGEVMEGHKHTFDHLHLLAFGEIEVEVEGKKAQYTAPTVLKILADKEHSITSISDKAVGYCIHPIRDGYRVEDIIDSQNVPALVKQGFIDEASKVFDSESSPWDVDAKELL